MVEKLKLSFRNLGDAYYKVYFNSLLLGEVYRDDDAWSYAKWFIVGGRKEKEVGGVNGSREKYAGYTSRASAARALAVMKSAGIVREANETTLKEQGQQ